MNQEIKPFDMSKFVNAAIDELKKGKTLTKVVRKKDKVNRHFGGGEYGCWMYNRYMVLGLQWSDGSETIKDVYLNQSEDPTDYPPEADYLAKAGIYANPALLGKTPEEVELIIEKAYEIYWHSPEKRKFEKEIENQRIDVQIARLKKRKAC